MAEKLARKKIIEEIFKAMPHLLKFPVGEVWIDYDKEADVLYVNFKRPQKATDTEMLENGVLLRYRGKVLVGVTILNASKKKDGVNA